MKRKLPVLAGGAVLALSCLLAYVFADRERMTREAFGTAAAERIEARIDGQVAVLHNVRALFESHDGRIARPMLARYLASIDLARRSPGARGIGYLMAQPAGDTDAAERFVHDNYGVTRAVWPDTTEPIRFPVVLMEPADDRNLAALGFDMYAEPARRAALDAARDRGVDTMTGRIRLVQEIDADQQLGFVIFLPFFGPADGAVRGDLRGFVFAPFRAGDLFRAVLADELAGRMELRAYSDAVDPANLLFATADTVAGATVHEIEVAGHRLTLELGDAASGTVPAAAYLTVLLGSLLAVAAGLLIDSQIRRTEAAEALAAEISARAADKQILLDEMKHRLKNALARVQSIARLSARDTSSVEDFLAAFDGRLGAMAAAQDMVAGSEGQRADLRSLIDAELCQVASPGSRAIAMSGPPVALTEAQTQAMALVVHELATNSAKYGAVANDGGLAVTWTVAGADPAELSLVWRETGLAGLPEEVGSGFGTRLIGLMVEGQLRGRVSREVSDGELEIALSFPLADPDDGELG